MYVYQLTSIYQKGRYHLFLAQILAMRSLKIWILMDCCSNSVAPRLYVSLVKGGDTQLALTMLAVSSSCTT